mgnify:CR=1 FL=1
MSRIKLISPAGDQPLEVHFGGKQDLPYLLLNLSFAGSGLNVIEEIKKGHILFHKIVVRDAAGRVLGEEPINFQVIKMTETRLKQSESDVYISPDNQQIKIGDEKHNQEVVRRSYTIRAYSEDEPVAQVIRLRELPDSNTPISIYVVLHYVQPILLEVCKEFDGTSCPMAEHYTFRETKEELQKMLQLIKAAYQKQEDLPGFQLKNPPEWYRKQMKENISRINELKQEPPGHIRVLNVSNEESKLYANVGSFGSRLYYREWKLLSEPTYFRVRIVQRAHQSEFDESKVETESNKNEK